ncbi:efflux RND transporter permease subunit [Kineobactrum salinum]|uniref:Efflux RND transporter permease subunit n=1 Tax=Kineobactrum salinum TaxID=2708301 RepID=A0A6C0TY12_9GAMM|nr:efflux RND transporter permease subunit [Kineobactrum salinum]QIB64423.1 efflux RND transporter permease subunit [Kineobactrum salinum]
MERFIRAAQQRSRATLLLFLILVIGGIGAYTAIPKEANPDVPIPIIYVSMVYEGVSPEDSERLMVRPMEQELRAQEGLRKMTSAASEGHASVMLEFDAGFDADSALQDVRERVDRARAYIPQEAEEPTVHEVNVALFPVLSVGLSGPLSEAELIQTARQLKEEIEGITEVLEVEIGGDREDLLEILVEPQVLASYGINYAELFNLVSRNNQLVAAGSLDVGKGRFSMKVPSVIENIDDVMSVPVKVDGDTVVTFGDVATLRRTFFDPEGFARINDQPAVVLEISKRTGANVIDTVAQVRKVMEQAKSSMPAEIQVNYILDQSKEVRSLLSELLNNVMTAVALVLIIIVATMGVKSAVMVGVTIPGAFFTAILVIWAIGYTMNMIVLFALILVAGMLVDGALVVSELADRNRRDGDSPRDAWANAASRMSWPIIASTATTLAVFFPLLFWPGVVGEFMKYLPATVIICLLASLAMALVFLPTLGGVSGSTQSPVQGESRRLAHWYRSSLNYSLQRPWWTLFAVMLVIVVIYVIYAVFNKGVEFFPSVEPESAQVTIRARGDLSVHEIDDLVRQVERRLLNMPEVDALYARSIADPDWNTGVDTVGTLQFQFIDWEQRRSAREILEEMRERTRDIPGIILEFRQQEQGPGEGKPFQLTISSPDLSILYENVEKIRQTMAEVGGFTDASDDRAIPGIEWRVQVDREAAARMGTDVATVGSAVQMITNGILLARYRPEDALDEVDIRLRFPESWRNIDQLRQLAVQTPRGQLPVSQVAEFLPSPKVGTLRRVDGERAVTIEADLEEGYLLDERLQTVQDIALTDIPANLEVSVGGEGEDQQEAAEFLILAFFAATFLMSFILVVQFNSLFQTALVLSAIVLSTAGILLGLLITAQPFGVVMVGMGVVALAGIVVNNNIVLIDTYNEHRRKGLEALPAALETGCLRLRPVLLTAATTILGLMPMVLGINVNLLAPSLGIGAPSTQWWTQLSSAIAGGLAFATVLTLLLTPVLLVLGDRVHGAWRRRRGLEA